MSIGVYFIGAILVVIGYLLLTQPTDEEIGQRRRREIQRIGEEMQRERITAETYRRIEAARREAERQQKGRSR